MIEALTSRPAMTHRDRLLRHNKRLIALAHEPKGSCVGRSGPADEMNREEALAIVDSMITFEIGTTLYHAK